MKKIFAYILLLVPISLLAQVDRTKVPKPGPAPVINIGEPATFTLANGLKVFVVRNTKLPRVSAVLAINREQILEGDKAGVTDLGGQLLRRGTTSLKKAELDEAIDYLGATISTSATTVSGSSLTNNFSKVVALMSDIVLRPSFPTDELEKIRKQTLSGLAQQKEDPNAIASNVVSRLVYGKAHPYGEIETETTVKNITVDDVKNYFSTNWKPNIAYLIFVGDITVEQARQLAETNFSKWQRGEVPKPVYTVPQPTSKTFIALVDRPSSVQSVINIVAPIQLKPGSPDAIASSVTANLLGGGASARLFKNLREKYGFTYGAYAGISEDKLVGNFTASASVRNEKTDSAIGQFFYEFNRLRNELAEPSEVSLIKNEASGGFARRLENPATIANYALNVERYSLPKDYYQSYLKNLAVVDAAKIQQIANKYIPVNNLSIIIVGNVKEIAKGLEKYGELKYFDTEGNEIKAPVTKTVDASLSGESIIKKCAEVTGASSLASIKDMEVIGTASVMGQNLGFSQKFILPNNFYQSISVGAMTVQKQMAKNGVYSSVQQGADQPLKDEDKEELEENAAVIAESYYQTHGGYSFVVKGIEPIDGKDAYAVEVKSPKGTIYTNYYDVKSSLKVKKTVLADGPGGEKVPVSTYYQEYKTYNGVQIPMKTILDQGQFKINIVNTDVKLNQGLKIEDWK